MSGHKQVPGLALGIVLMACAGNVELSGAPMATDTADSAVAPPMQSFARVIDTGGNGLRIRVEPSPDAELVGLIPETCVVDLSGEREGEWLRVRYEDMQGWSHQDYLEETPEDTAQCDPPTSSHVQVHGTGDNGLRIRTEPHTDAEVVDTIAEKCVATLTGRFNDEWVELRFRENTGWSHRDFVVEVPADTKQCGTDLCPNNSAHCWPLTPQHVTSEFGPRSGRLHEGIDFGAGTGHPVYATKAGTVIAATYHSGYGNYVRIDHGGGETTTYAHFSKIRVSNGQRVQRSQHIGDVGSTGRSTGPHLHYEIRFGGAPKNPRNYLP